MTVGIDDLRLFLLVIDKGSLAAAARELNVTPPAITQRLRTIERRFGVRLVDRSTRRIGLTDEGRLVRDRAQEIIRSFDGLMEAVQARKGLVQGELRVRAPLGFGRRYVAPIVARFQTTHPEVRVFLGLSDRPNRAGTDDRLTPDVIVHIGELRDSSQVAVTIAANERILCAAPRYVDRYGAPKSPGDLLQHRCLALRENDEDVTLWRFARNKRTEAVRIRPVLASNDGEVVYQWALAGKGVMVRSEWNVADDVRLGRLVRLLPDYRLPAANIVALVPDSRALSERTRAFLHFLKGQFRPHPPWRRPEDGRPTALGKAVLITHEAECADSCE